MLRKLVHTGCFFYLIAIPDPLRLSVDIQVRRLTIYHPVILFIRRGNTVDMAFSIRVWSTPFAIAPHCLSENFDGLLRHTTANSKPCFTCYDSAFWILRIRLGSSNPFAISMLNPSHLKLSIIKLFCLSVPKIHRPHQKERESMCIFQWEI